MRANADTRADGQARGRTDMHAHFHDPFRVMREQSSQFCRIKVFPVEEQQIHVIRKWFLIGTVNDQGCPFTLNAISDVSSVAEVSNSDTKLLKHVELF